MTIKPIKMPGRDSHNLTVDSCGPNTGLPTSVTSSLPLSFFHSSPHPPYLFLFNSLSSFPSQPSDPPHTAASSEHTAEESDDSTIPVSSSTKTNPTASSSRICRDLLRRLPDSSALLDWLGSNKNKQKQKVRVHQKQS